MHHYQFISGYNHAVNRKDMSVLYLCLKIFLLLNIGCPVPLAAQQGNAPEAISASEQALTSRQPLSLPKEMPPEFRFDQFAYVSDRPKRVVVAMPRSLIGGAAQPGSERLDSFLVYRIVKEEQHADQTQAKQVFRGGSASPVAVVEWFQDRVYYTLDVSMIHAPGHYRIKIYLGDSAYTSPVFRVEARLAFVRTGIGALLHYFRRQRANTAVEWEQDAHLKLKGSSKRVDLRGGWCDASGDVSKYFSHLAYTDFMSPQQIPLVTWSLVQATEKMHNALKRWGMLDSMRSESLWGADYLRRSLSDSGYFYMTVFSYFKKDPSYREIVGLEANSVTTTDYACAIREGAGMAIAALARISTWKRNGAFTSEEYLRAAESAYQHLLAHNRRYDDDGVPNIIDNYCGLMAATELWKATGRDFYKLQARIWAADLCARYIPDGYLRSDGEIMAGRIIKGRGITGRPFWHASDAGLPVVSLMRYLDLETGKAQRAKVIQVITALLKSQLHLDEAVPNPFDYPRQYFEFKGRLKSGFFIPHANESGWWWQGENARLASVSTALLLGKNLFHHIGDHSDSAGGYELEATASAMHQLSWITGCNPYGICFLYGYGYKNVPYMHSNYGHGSERGGISNGITGLNADGTGIAFKEKDNGNEWRWTEQWLPHAAWYLQALTALGRGK